MDEPDKPKEYIASQRVKYVRKREDDSQSSQLKIVQYFDETKLSDPTSAVDKHFADDGGREEDFLCITCRQPFNSLKDKLPYILPCEHNVCRECIQDCAKNGRDFFCPIDEFHMDDVTQAKVNENLFREVKLRERRLKLEADLGERQRIATAERVIKNAN